MPSEQPFQPSVKSGAVGETVVVVATLSPGTVATFPAGTTAILAQVVAPAGAAAYVRISAESSTAIQVTTSFNGTGTVADMPIWGAGLAAAAVVHLFASPGPSGATTICVAATVTSSPVTVYLTPGIGGLGTP